MPPQAPALHPPEPSYHYGKPYNLQKYVEFMTGQITELLTQYGPVAGISYKQGLLGTEDFIAPEHKSVPLAVHSSLLGALG